VRLSELAERKNMKRRDYILEIVIFISFILCSCEDPLKIEEALLLKEVNSPEFLITLNRTYHSVFLVWQEYTDKDFDRYEVYYNNGISNKYILCNIIKIASITSIAVDGLIPDNEYYFFVRTINKEGKSADSKLLLVKTFSDKPSVIKNIYAQRDIISDTMNTSTGILITSKIYYRIYWDIYTEKNIIPFSYYNIYYLTKRDDYSPVLYEKISEITQNYISLDLSKFKENTSYYFFVRTYNSLENYAESNPVEFITPFYVPDAVILNKDPQTTENSVLLNWTKSSCNSFERYEIHISKNIFIPDIKNIANTIKEKITSIETTQYLLSGLEKNEEYVCRILVYNKSELFSYSDWIGITTTKDGGPIPVILNQALNDDITSNSVKINWTISQSRFLSSYKIYISTKSNQTISNMQLVETIVEKSRNNYTIENLLPNTVYYINVPVFNSFGRYSMSNMLEIKTKN
jgi:hypothetical protein